MRENIGLFRGKREDNGEWVEGYLVCSKVSAPRKKEKTIRYEIFVPFTEEEEKENEGHIFSAVGGIWHEVHPDTIGECTGLKDKNGKLAFERDITEAALGRRWVIFGGKGGFRICRDTEWLSQNGDVRIVYEGLSDFQNGSWFEQNHTIIGNVTDNPELLKGGGENEDR